MKLRAVLTMFLSGILCGALAGYGVVQLYIQKNFLWIVAMLPWVFLLIFFVYKIRVIKKRINRIEANFKGKYGFDINDKEPFDKYLDSLVGNRNNRS
jgi:hypothetical protein